MFSECVGSALCKLKADEPKQVCCRLIDVKRLQTYYEKTGKEEGMDKNEFSQRVLEAEQTLYRISKSILINEADCEDAVQEAILRAYAKQDSLREVKYFKTWLVRILINECYQLLRSKKQELPYEDYFQEQQAEVNTYSELYDAILRLDRKHRLPVILFYMEGYSVEETARILKIPAGTVKSRLSRGRKQLKKFLDGEVEYNGKYV